MKADAIPAPTDALQAQLKEMGMEPHEALLLLQQQQTIKKKQRLDKAEKALQKGNAKGYLLATSDQLDAS